MGTFYRGPRLATMDLSDHKERGLLQPLEEESDGDVVIVEGSKEDQNVSCSQR